MKWRIIMENTNEYVNVNRKEFYGTCAELVTNAILANIYKKYGKGE